MLSNACGGLTESDLPPAGAGLCRVFFSNLAVAVK